MNYLLLYMVADSGVEPPTSDYEPDMLPLQQSAMMSVHFIVLDDQL